jgi:hypothetical protein
MWIQVVNACASKISGQPVYIQIGSAGWAACVVQAGFRLTQSERAARRALERNDEGCMVTLAGYGNTQFLLKIHCDLANSDVVRMACRMLKMAVQRGRSELSLTKGWLG